MIEPSRSIFLQCVYTIAQTETSGRSNVSIDGSRKWVIWPIKLPSISKKLWSLVKAFVIPVFNRGFLFGDDGSVATVNKFSSLLGNINDAFGRIANLSKEVSRVEEDLNVTIGKL